MNRVSETPTELKERLEAERRGLPFVVFRESAGTQRLITLDPGRAELTIGRAPECDVRIEGDAEVSRLHALLLCRSASWTIDDAGLSRNGTFVNGERVRGHRVLRNRDVVRAGMTDIRFFNPVPERTRTAIARPHLGTPAVSRAQQRILIALCTPYRRRSPFARPASNQKIAGELCLSEETVRTHLRALFALFGLEDVAQNEKRVRLVEEAFMRGVVRDSDLGDDAERS